MNSNLCTFENNEFKSRHIIGGIFFLPWLEWWRGGGEFKDWEEVNILAYLITSKGILFYHATFFFYHATNLRGTIMPHKFVRNKIMFSYYYYVLGLSICVKETCFTT